jgi:Flp pilus assembly protein TadD
MGEDDHALTVMQKAEAWYTRHPELHRRKAEIMMRKGNLSEAERLIQAAIGFKPRSASYHVTYGRILLARGKPDPAIREAQQAIRLDGRIVPAFVLLSEAFRDKKDLRIADHFKRVSEMIMQWN